MSFDLSNEYVSIMQGDVLDQYRGLPNIDAILAAAGAQFNDIEEMFGQLSTLRQLLNATGQQLDNLGAGLGPTARNGLSDLAYQNLLFSKVVQFNGQATPNDLINVANLIGAPVALQYIEPDFATIQLNFTDPNPIGGNLVLLAALLQAKLAGVLLEANEASSPVFTYDLTDANHAGYDRGHYLGPIT